MRVVPVGAVGETGGADDHVERVVAVVVDAVVERQFRVQAEVARQRRPPVGAEAEDVDGRQHRRHFNVAAGQRQRTAARVQQHVRIGRIRRSDCNSLANS